MALTHKPHPEEIREHDDGKENRLDDHKPMDNLLCGTS
jgi:hypothetical protein